MHAVDMFVDVPVAAIPALVGEPVFNGVEPIFGGFIYLTLINAREIRFRGRVLRGASMREHHIHLPIARRKGLLDALLRPFAWLLVGKPRQTVFAAPELIDAVRSPDSDSGESFYVIDLSIHGEEDLRERILYHDGCPEALFLMIEFRERLRARLMIAMDAQQGRGNARRQLFRLAITSMQVEVETRIAEYDDGILGRERMSFAKTNQIPRVAVYVASDVNHSGRILAPCGRSVKARV